MSWARRVREAPPTYRRDGIDVVKFVSGTNNAMIKVESVVTSPTFRTHSWCSIKTFAQLTSIHWAGPTSLSSIAALGEAQIQFIWSEKWDARTLHTSEITTSGKCQTDWDKHRGSSDVKWKKYDEDRKGENATSSFNLHFFLLLPRFPWSFTFLSLLFLHRLLILFAVLICIFRRADENIFTPLKARRDGLLRNLKMKTN